MPPSPLDSAPPVVSEEPSMAPLFVLSFPEWLCLGPLSVIFPSSQVSFVSEKHKMGQKCSV